MPKNLQLLLFSFLVAVAGYPQEPQEFFSEEDSLAILSAAIVKTGIDSQRLERNSMFMEYFQEVLLQDNNLNWPFDSLKAVNVLNDPLGNFRIFSWYVPLSNRQYRYFGFVQLAGNENENTRIHVLNDNTESIDNPGSIILDNQNWYGAWYYELIHNSFEGEDYYTLLGWKGYDQLTNQRIIEPVSINSEGVIFGAPVFENVNASLYRIVFRYSSSVSMSLKYEKQNLPAGLNAQHMIIFDRLSPTHESLEGYYQYYVPEVNIFDGFYFEEGYWVFVRDVDMRIRR